MERKRWTPDPTRRLTLAERADGSTFVNITCELAAELAAQLLAGDNLPKLSHIFFLAQHVNTTELAHKVGCPALTNPALVAELANLAAVMAATMAETGD